MLGLRVLQRSHEPAGDGRGMRDSRARNNRPCARLNSRRGIFGRMKRPARRERSFARNYQSHTLLQGLLCLGLLTATV